MEHIKNQLDIVLRKKGLMKIAVSAQVCTAFNNLKKEKFGDKTDIEAISFNNGKLRIKTGSSLESSELRLKEREIKRELNQKLKKSLVEKIEAKITP